MSLKIHSTNNTIKKMYKSLNLEYNDDIYVNDDITLLNKFKEILYSVNLPSQLKNKEEHQYSNIEKLVVGDHITVEYMPCSQRYIDNYPPCCGILLYVDVDNYDGVIFTCDSEGNDLYQSFILPGCHYFGMDLGYYMFFRK